MTAAQRLESNKMRELCESQFKEKLRASANTLIAKIKILEEERESEINESANVSNLSMEEFEKLILSIHDKYDLKIENLKKESEKEGENISRESDEFVKKTITELKQKFQKMEEEIINKLERLEKTNIPRL